MKELVYLAHVGLFSHFSRLTLGFDLLDGDLLFAGDRFRAMDVSSTASRFIAAICMATSFARFRHFFESSLPSTPPCGWRHEMEKLRCEIASIANRDLVGVSFRRLRPVYLIDEVPAAGGTGDRYRVEVPRLFYIVVRPRRQCFVRKLNHSFSKKKKKSGLSIIDRSILGSVRIRSVRRQIDPLVLFTGPVCVRHRQQPEYSVE